jgi:hypothetical protein
VLFTFFTDHSQFLNLFIYPSSDTGTQPVPTSASEVPLTGLEAGKDVPFGEQVKGHAKVSIYSSLSGK